MAVYFTDNLNAPQDSPEMEEFVVVIKLKEFDGNINITYKNSKSPTIKEISEEGTNFSCKFKGRSNNKALACDWLKEIKSCFQGMKPNDWILHNPDNFIDAFHKIH